MSPETQHQKDLRRLRRERQLRVEQMLADDMRQHAPGNAAYWLTVVLGAFALNLGLLILLAR